MFSKQKVFCPVCGAERSAHVHATDSIASIVCNSQCYDELQWRSALSTMGKEYYPQPPKK